LNLPKEQRKKFVPVPEQNNIPKAISLQEAIKKALPEIQDRIIKDEPSEQQSASTAVQPGQTITFK
jgi:hypothetical protein